MPSVYSLHANEGALFARRHGSISIRDAILPLACFAIYCAWSSRLPIALAPDEPMRLAIPCYILEHGVLPFGDEKEIMSDIWGTSYAFIPYGSSLLSVLFMRICMIFTHSRDALVWSARLGSAVPSCGTVFVCQLIGNRVFSKRSSTYVFASIVGLLPQFVFCSSYLNNESIMVFSIALIIHSWLIGMNTEWNLASKVYLGVALGICSLSYYFAYGYILASIAVFFMTSRGVETRGKSIGKLPLRGAILVFAIAFCVGGWFFVRNFVLHQGDIFGMHASQQTAEVNAIEGFKPSDHISPIDEGLTPIDTVFSEYRSIVWWKTTMASSIGKFGYMNISLGRNTYIAYGVFFLIGMICSVPAFFNHYRRERFFGLVCIGLMLFSIGMSVYYSWASDYQPQGRYLASALLPFALFVTDGYEWLASLAGHMMLGRSSDAMGTRVGLLSSNNLQEEVLLLILIFCYLMLFLHVAVTVILPQCCQGIFWGAGYTGIQQPTQLLLQTLS